MDEPAGGDTLRQDQDQTEASRRLSGREAARQDPSAPAVAGYVLASRLGAGAYGEVWKAWQQRTGKWVALKTFPRRHGVDWLLLQREVERLIKLDKHPHVVSLLDADLTGDLPYFAMELMEGGSLSRFVDPEKRATPEQAARWAEQIGEALCYVHSKGILHCDLKPANVLLDDEGRVRVADFGQSRIASESTGALGTLYFMAPEQALTFKQNEQLCPDVRWDLFGLGATLHAVLTGRPPHEAALKPKLEAVEGLEARLELYRDALRREPVPRSCADEDLDAIVRCCLAPWPERRYTAARELLADLAARKEGRPVSPLADGTLYRWRKFVRRHAVPVALGALLAAALGGATAAIVSKNALLKSELANAYLLRARAASDKGDDVSAGLLYARANALLPSAPARRGALAHLKAVEKPRHVWQLSSAAGAVAVSPDGSRVLVAGQEPMLLDARGGGVLARMNEGGAMRLGLIGEGRGAAFSADGSRAFLDEGTGSTVLLDGASGKELSSLDGGRARFSPDGKLVATQDKRVVRFWDAATGKPVGGRATHQAPDASWEGVSFEFSPDGKALLTCLKESIQLWEVPSGRPLGSIAYDSETRMAIGPLEEAHFSPDGSAILSVTWARAALFDRRGRTLGKVMRHDGRISHAAFSMDGYHAGVLTAGEDGTIRKWLAKAVPRQGYDAGAPADSSLRHGAPISALAVDPNGRLAATGGMDGVARLWGLDPWDASGKADGPPWGPYGGAMPHAGAVTAAAFSADGKTLATASRDGTVRVWDVPGEQAGSMRLKLFVSDSRIFPDGSRLFAFDYSVGARLLALPSGAGVAGPLVPGAHGKPRHVQFQGLDKAGKRFAGLLRDGEHEAWVFDAADGKRVAGPFGFGAGKELQFARLSPDGGRLLLSATHEGLALFDVASGKKLDALTGLGFVHDAAFSPDGRLLAVSGMDTSQRDYSKGLFSSGNHTELRDASKLERVAREVKHGGGTVVWSADGRRLATADDQERTVRLWDAASGSALGKEFPHQDRLIEHVFSPDGRVLLTGSNDGTAWLVDAAKGEPIAKLAHGAEVRCLAISPDGSTAAVGLMDGLIKLWDTRTGQPVGPPLPQERLVTELAFTPDGRTLYSVGAAFKGWDMRWLTEQPAPDRLLSAAQSLTQRRVDEQGAVAVIAVSSWDRGALLP